MIDSRLIEEKGKTRLLCKSTLTTSRIISKVVSRSHDGRLMRLPPIDERLLGSHCGVVSAPPRMSTYLVGSLLPTGSGYKNANRSHSYELRRR